MGNANDEELRLQAWNRIPLYTSDRLGGIAIRGWGSGGYFPSSGKLAGVRVIMGVRSETPMDEWSRNPIRKNSGELRFGMHLN